VDPKTPLKTIGLPARVRMLREWSGKKPAALARIARLGESHVRLMEEGDRRCPSAETLARLADACGVDLSWLATGSGRQPRPKAVAAAVALAEARRLAGAA
jgi:transcriptional regulator with XRE-family HTH domain